MVDLLLALQHQQHGMLWPCIQHCTLLGGSMVRHIVLDICAWFPSLSISSTPTPFDVILSRWLCHTFLWDVYGRMIDALCMMCSVIDILLELKTLAGSSNGCHALSLSIVCALGDATSFRIVRCCARGSYFKGLEIDVVLARQVSGQHSSQPLSYLFIFLLKLEFIYSYN